MPRSLSPSERSLIRRCRRGDDAAWQELHDAYSADIGRFLRGMVRHGDIDELVQRVFVELMSALPRFRGHSSLRTWLLRIARNVALYEIRSASRRKRHLSRFAEESDVTGPPVDARVHARHRLEQILTLVDQLDPPFREVWLLREVSGCTGAEVADILGIPTTTVRTRHHRARQQLVQRLEDHDGAVARPACSEGTS